MVNASVPSLRELVQAVPPECYERPTWRGVVYLVRALLIYALLLWALWRFDHPLLLLVLWPLTGLAISGLFVLAHDAAHAALFDSQRMNQLVARLALLPTLHAASVWTLGHNRIHHVHTNRAGVDFVWHPLSPEQFRKLSVSRQRLHRFEWSPAGMGIYYLRNIWWQRMMRFPAPHRFAAVFRADRALVLAYAVAWSLGLVVLGYRSGGSSGAVWLWLKLALIPWLLWNYFIAGTVFLQHADPASAWWQDPQWRRTRGQVESSTNFTVPRWYNLFAHNIYLHLPHHIDPRIPFYHLPAALEALQTRYPHLVRFDRLTCRHFFQVMGRCKLFDFTRGEWTSFPSYPALTGG